MFSTGTSSNGLMYLSEHQGQAKEQVQKTCLAYL